MNTPIQHGENILIPIAKLPKGKTQEHKIVIVGHSETGHHHGRFSSGSRLWRDKGAVLGYTA